jgi:hypothetical protein
VLTGFAGTGKTFLTARLIGRALEAFPPSDCTDAERFGTFGSSTDLVGRANFSGISLSFSHIWNHLRAADHRVSMSLVSCSSRRTCSTLNWRARFSSM